MLELLEGVRRQRFGVNGGGSVGGAEGPLPDLRRRLGSWLLDAASGGRPVKVGTA
jgi:hypothetical protein